MSIKKKFKIKGDLKIKKVCQLIETGEIENLLNTDTKISNEIIVNKIEPIYIKCEALTENKAIVFYRNANTSFIEAIILSIEENNIIVGTPKQITTLSSRDLNIMKLDENRVVLAYDNNSSTTLKTEYMIISIIENTIIIGKITVGTSRAAYVPALIKINENQIMSIYKTGTSIVCALFKIESNVLTEIKNYISTSGSATETEAVKINDNTILVIYNNYTTSRLESMLIKINNENITNTIPVTISDDKPMAITSSTQKYIVSVKIDENKSLIAYTNEKNNLTTIILSVENDVINIREVKKHDYNGIGVLDINALNKNNIIITTHWRYPYSIKKYIFKIVKDEIKIRDFLVLTGKEADTYMNCSMLNENKQITLYRKELYSERFLGGFIFDYYSYAAKAIGIVEDGEGNVTLKGISKNHTGLLTGEKYYYNENGDISTDSAGKFLGVALSDTELYMPNYIIE